MSSSVLSTRLNELTQTGIVQVDGGSYRLTSLGADLIRALLPLQNWAAEWDETLGRSGPVEGGAEG
jgi:DNA-binding HxlR family transcriptional regulator